MIIFAGLDLFLVCLTLDHNWFKMFRLNVYSVHRHFCTNYKTWGNWLEKLRLLQTFLVGLLLECILTYCILSLCTCQSNYFVFKILFKMLTCDFYTGRMNETGNEMFSTKLSTWILNFLWLEKQLLINIIKVIYFTLLIL